MEQDFSFMEKDDFICPLIGVINIVGSHENGDPRLCHLIYNVVYHLGMLWIQGRCRLVQDNDIRVHDQDICNGNLLLLTSA